MNVAELCCQEKYRQFRLGIVRMQLTGDSTTLAIALHTKINSRSISDTQNNNYSDYRASSLWKSTILNASSENFQF